ncbi:MAG: hypothetical protein ABIR57_12065 [Aeromicrobium sp.]
MSGVLIAADGAPWESEALAFLNSSTDFGLERRCVDVADLLSAAQTGDAVAALISLDLPGLDADIVYRLFQSHVHPVAVDGETNRCAALGITTRLGIGELSALADLLPRAEVQVDDALPAVGAGALVAVWGPGGAPGRSTVALGLADAWAREGLRTILVDADPYGGAIAQMLGVLDEVSGLLAASRAANEGRAAELTEHLYGVSDRLAVLTGLPRPDLWSQVRTGAAQRLLGQLRTDSDVSVLDVGFCLEDAGSFDSAAPRRNQLTLQSLEEADHVVAVGRADPVGLTRLVRGLHDLDSAIPSAEVSVLINMTRATIGWSEAEIADTVERLTGRKAQAFLPLDQSAVDEALINGRLLGESRTDSRLAKALNKFAQEWATQHLKVRPLSAAGR